MFARLMGLRTISPGRLHETMQDQQVTVVDINSRESQSAKGQRRVTGESRPTGVNAPNAHSP